MRCLFIGMLMTALATAVTATVLVSGQTTTIVTSGTPVQVAWEGFPRVPRYWSDWVMCGDFICGLNTNVATHNYTDIALNGLNGGATIDVTNVPVGSQPSISIYKTGSAIGTWNLTSGSNSNFAQTISPSLYPVNTVFSVYVNGGANTQFAFSPYESVNHVGFLFSVQ